MHLLFTVIYKANFPHLHTYPIMCILAFCSENANHSISITYDIYAALLGLHCGYYDTKDTTSQKMAGFLTLTTLYGAIFFALLLYCFESSSKTVIHLELVLLKELGFTKSMETRRSTHTLHIFAQSFIAFHM